MHPVFKRPAYRRLWLNAAGDSISYGGDFVLIGWMALAATGTSAWVGTALALYVLPKVLLGLPAGSLADRFDRRRLIQALELVSALAIALFALAFRGKAMALPEVLALTLCLGSLRALYTPLRLSYTYDIAGPRMITPALAGIALGGRLGMLAGALLIGTLAERFGLAAALMVMVAAHLAAWLALVGHFGETASRRPDATPILQSLKAFFWELRGNRTLLALTLVTASIEVFGVSLHSVLPEVAENRLELGVQGLGWMLGAQASGGLIIGGIIFLVPQGRNSFAAFAASLLFLGASLVVLGAVEGLASVLVTLAVISASITAWDIFTQSMMQRCVTDSLRGRAMGAWVFAIGSAPLGHLEIGFLAAAAGTQVALTVNGLAVIAILAVAILVTPVLRRL
jgi:MFS family permease